MLKKFVVVAVTLLALGCQNKKEPTQEEAAQKRWNDARASVLYSVAQDQYKSHDFDKCKQTIGQALKMSPSSAPLLVLAAKVDIEQSKLEQAEGELETARKWSPQDPEAYYLSGVIYQRWQKPETALEFYRQAAQRAPGELPYVLAQGEMLVSTGHSDQALQLLQAKVAYFENSATIRDAVGQLLLHAGKYAEAVDMLRQASILASDDLTIRERLALAYYYNKQFRECAQTLQKLLDNDTYAKRGDLLEIMGECQMNLGQPRDARGTFQQATDLNPYSAHLWQSYGRAALESNDLKRANVALNKAVSLEPSNSGSYLLIGYVQVREKKLKEALAAFQKASALDPKDTVSLCMIGYVLEKMGRPETAIQYYAKALKIKPGDDMAAQLMAGVDTREGH
jgi:tetratricopeptide (TPR) repeat protein